MKIEHVLENLVNGNLTDAKQGAKRHSSFRISMYARQILGWELAQACAAAQFLKGKISFELYCQANEPQAATGGVNHTPGPWHIGLNPGPILYGPKGEQIADLRGSLLTVEEAAANRHLLKASPRLLAALDMAEVDRLHDELSELLEEPLADLNDIREASVRLTVSMVSAYAIRRAAIAEALNT